MDLLQKGATITAESGQGVDSKTLGESLIAFKASYDLAKGLWPTEIPSDGIQESFDTAIQAWDIVFTWHKGGSRLKIYKGSSQWRTIGALTNHGENLEIKIEDYDEAFKGIKYFWLDKDLAGRLLGVASDHFDAGKMELLNQFSGRGS